MGPDRSARSGRPVKPRRHPRPHRIALRGSRPDSFDELTYGVPVCVVTLAPGGSSNSEAGGDAE
jgi:hypothetical protein